MHTTTQKKLNLLMFIILAGSLVTLAGQARPAAAANLAVQPRIYLPLLFNGYTPGMFGAVTGLIIDATKKNTPLAGAKVCVVGVHCVYSQADGSFYLGDIPKDSPRNLTVTPSSPDYVNYSQTIQISSAAPLYLVISLSPANLPAGGMRIVLTWQVEGDLDAHLWVGSTHIYWRHLGDCSNACLQNDSTYFGPETIMVKGGLGGTLSFAVARNGDPEVPQYTPLVQVYDENGLKTSFTPKSGVGSWWYVFDMVWDSSTSHYTLTTRNELLNHPPYPY